MKRARSILTAVFLALFLGAGFFSAAGAADYQDIMVRVAILDDSNHLRLYIKEPYKIFAIGSDTPILEGSRIDTKVISVKDGLLIRDKVYNVSGIRILADKESRVCVDKKIYRGEIDVIRKGNGRLLVVNYVAMEDYLFGVLYHEVSHRWPMEALKVQAIAARTFAVYQAMNNKMQPYDLRSDVYSQVYGGSGSERWSTNMAVNATRGKVLTYGGKVLPAYYHATCAGRTEDATNLWKVDLPPLDGVACDDCAHSPYYNRWLLELPLWELEGILRKNGYAIGKISDTAILSRNASGRVDKIELKDSQGVSVVLTGKDFRQMIGPNKLRSTKFDISIKWGNLILEGRGWGHGVGMCQWGAFGKAKAGMKAEEILKIYYPGIEVTTVDKLKPN